MLPREPGAAGVYFHREVRCCTYIPAIPNFLVGRLTGEESVARRISLGVGVTPAGLLQSGAFRVLYQQTPGAFGRAADLRCPHLAQGGSCSIWHSRPAVCATWFCKHDRGGVGREFWRLLGLLLGEAEYELQLWCLGELGVGLDQAAAGLDGPRADEIGAPPDPARHRRLWGAWAGQETEFYRECARLVEPLSWQGVTRIGGARLGALAKLTREAFHALRREPGSPRRIRFTGVRAHGVRNGKVVLEGYSEFDPVTVPSDLFAILPAFNGQPIGEIATARGARIHPMLVRKLVDFGILSELEDDLEATMAAR